MTKFLSLIVPALALTFATTYSPDADAAPRHQRPHAQVHAPPAHKVWVPGHLELRAGKIIWVAGHYTVAPKGKAVWVPGHWEMKHGKRVWISGYWR